MIKIIYAQNGTGKTLECEKKTSKNIVLFPKKFNAISNYSIPKETSLETIKEGEEKEWTLALKDKKHIPFLQEKDIKLINNVCSFIGIKIQNKEKVNLESMVIKKGNSKFSFLNKLPVSSGEENFIKTIIALTSYQNIYENIIIDDPIELASYKMEILFIEFLRKHFDTINLTIYTHNYSLFKLVNRLPKKNRKMYHWIDKNKYIIDNFSYDSDNDFIKRIFFEKIKKYKKLYDFSIFWKNNNIIEKNYGKVDLQYGKIENPLKNYLDYLSSKIYYFQMMREAVLLDCGLDVNKSKLNQVKKEKCRIIKDEYYFEQFVFMLNQSLHFYDQIDQTEEQELLIETISYNDFFNIMSKAIFKRTKNITNAVKNIKNAIGDILD